MSTHSRGRDDKWSTKYSVQWVPNTDTAHLSYWRCKLSRRKGAQMFWHKHSSFTRESYMTSLLPGSSTVHSRKIFAKTIFWNSSSPVGINGGLSANQSLWHLTRGEKIVSPHPKTEYVGEGSQLQKLDRTAWGVMLNSHASKTYSSQFIAPPDWRLNHQHIPTANHWV